jgi:DNA-binding response OmpR family regulator
VRILVAADDKGLGAVLVRGLRNRDYTVDLVSDGEAAAAYLVFYQYEVAVIDWWMPKLTGLDLVAWLRRTGSSVPVLMLTARDTPADRITGLGTEADDYLAKPFDFGELLARLRALQRRQGKARPATLTLGGLELDLSTHEVRFGRRQPSLTGIEFSMLEILLRRSPGVADRRTIARHAWPDEADTLASDTLDQHLAGLRSKLACAGVRIETIRGVGYRIVAA